jgi:hypothetical protein
MSASKAKKPAPPVVTVRRVNGKVVNAPAANQAPEQPKAGQEAKPTIPTLKPAPAPQPASPPPKAEVPATVCDGCGKYVCVCPLAKPAPAPTVTAPRASTAPKASNAVVAHVPPAGADEQIQHEVQPLTGVKLPSSALEAAILVAPKDDTRTYLNGVFLHRVGADVRVVTTNGSAMLVQSFPATEAELQQCTWLDKGIIIPREIAERARKALPDQPIVEFGAGQPRLVIRDAKDEVTLRGAPIESAFPDYAKVMTDAGKVLEGGERGPLDATTQDPKLTQLAVKVASCLDSKSINIFQGPTRSGASVYTFGGAPGVLLLVMPMQAEAEVMPATTARLIGPAGLKGTLAALRAHQTRNLKAAKAEKDPKKKKAAQDLADSFKSRIAALVAASSKALPAPVSPVKIEKPETPVSPVIAAAKAIAQDAATPPVKH